MKCRAVGSGVRALASHARSRRFDSCTAHLPQLYFVKVHVEEL